MKTIKSIKSKISSFFEDELVFMTAGAILHISTIVIGIYFITKYAHVILGVKH